VTPRAHGEWKQEQQLPARRHDGSAWLASASSASGPQHLVSAFSLRGRAGAREWNKSGIESYECGGCAPAKPDAQPHKHPQQVACRSKTKLCVRLTK
jgi:hypothetical protein